MAEGCDGPRVQGRGVFLVVELQQATGMRAVTGDEGSEILQQHHPIGDRGSGIVAEMKATQDGRGRGPHRTLAGGLPVER